MSNRTLQLPRSSTLLALLNLFCFTASDPNRAGRPFSHWAGSTGFHHTNKIECVVVANKQIIIINKTASIEVGDNSASNKIECIVIYCQ